MAAAGWREVPVEGLSGEIRSIRMSVGIEGRMVIETTEGEFYRDIMLDSNTSWLPWDPSDEAQQLTLPEE